MNSGSKLELVGCTLHSQANAVKIASDQQDGGATLNLTKSELTAKIATGTSILAHGEHITASVVGCSITGFETAAVAIGRETKLSFRECKVARCGRAFSARSDSTVVRVDCKLDAVERPDEAASGGRVVDV